MKVNVLTDKGGARSSNWRFEVGGAALHVDESWYSRLKPGEFFNDGLIDFYALWLQRETNTNSSICVLGTEFLYNRPTLDNIQDGLLASRARKLQTLKAHNSKISGAKLLVFPVHGQAHYVLIVVWQPFLAYEGIATGGCILWFDSLNGHGDRTLATMTKKIRDYLADVWFETHPTTTRAVPTDYELPVVKLRVPQQGSGTNDCGPLTLYSIELLLGHNWGNNCEEFSEDAVQTLLNENDKVPDMRAKIREAFDSARPK